MPAPPDEERLARHLMRIAAVGGMPYSYWSSDKGILLARRVLVRHYGKQKATEIENIIRGSE